MYYLPQAFFGGVAGIRSRYAVRLTVGGGAKQYIPANSLSNPFPNGCLTRPEPRWDSATFAGQQRDLREPESKIPHANQWSFGVQHQLPWQILSMRHTSAAHV